jgi:hypothetical protein
MGVSGSISLLPFYSRNPVRKIEEISLVQQTREEMEVLFTFFAER